MNKVLLGAAVMLLLLTGCSAAETADEPTEQRQQTETAPSETPPPLTAEDPATVPEDPDAEFVAYVRSELALLPSTGIAKATDEQLIVAGQEACEQLRAGVNPETIRLVEGEEPAASGYYMDTATIVGGAMRAYCPDTAF